MSVEKTKITVIQAITGPQYLQTTKNLRFTTVVSTQMILAVAGAK